MTEKHLEKWKLILSKRADPQAEVLFDAEMGGMDDTLEALYEGEGRKGGLGGSSPKVNRWLGDIRKYFPTSVVQIMQRDAMERLGIREMLLEPELLETFEPDAGLVATLLSMRKVIPEKTKETARILIRKFVEDIERKLTNPMREAVKGSINRAVRNRRPKYNEIDWHKTIRANLKNYRQELGAIIPEQLIGHGKKGAALRHIILLIDQSGSMGTSVVYSGIFGSILASLKSVKTHFIVFDTSVVDLTDSIDDPVDLLFGTQIGGGTDINKALGYTQKLITRPEETILVLISDLYEGGNQVQMMHKINAIKSSGVNFITLLALDDNGAPAYDHAIANKLAAMDIPAFACTPDKFPDLIATAIKKEKIEAHLFS